MNLSKASQTAPAVDARPRRGGQSASPNVLGITKGRRSAYDHFMLQLHDRMKADLGYQAEVDQTVFEFGAGSTWIVFTDQVSHAAMSGQYALEQTYCLPVACMLDPSRAPLRILEHRQGVGTWHEARALIQAVESRSPVSTQSNG